MNIIFFLYTYKLHNLSYTTQGHRNIKMKASVGYKYMYFVYMYTCTDIPVCSYKTQHLPTIILPTI